MKTHHGSPYDRGSADSYYRRRPSPHYYGGNYQRYGMEAMTKEEIAAYHKGFEDNEKDGHHKEWE